jgi:class 3 adenylate cyclase
VLMGGVDDGRRGVAPPRSAGGPIIEVHASGLWGGVTIKTKRRKNREVAEAAPTAGLPTTQSPTSMMSLMVTDIVGSTRMAERLGDQRWLQVLQAHNEIVRRQVDVHGGTEVKQNGDGFLLTFPSSRSAVLAGLGVRDEIGRYGVANPDSSLQLRIGVHAGEVARDGHDVFGVNVSTADRLSAAAEPGEVLVSGVVADLAGSSSDLCFGPGREIEISGRSQPIRVHRVDAAP